MELKEIQELVKLVSRSNVSEVDIKRKDFEITIKSEVKKKKGQDDEQQVIVQQVPQPVAQPQPAPAPAPAQSPAPAPADSGADEAKSDDSGSGNTEEIKSPMIGTFYRSASPDKPPFVNVGDKIQKGDVICIIEAMKLFNEIEAEVSGTVVKVIADDASPVEYDQPLFVIEPA